MLEDAVEHLCYVGKALSIDLVFRSSWNTHEGGEIKAKLRTQSILARLVINSCEFDYFDYNYDAGMTTPLSELLKLTRDLEPKSLNLIFPYVKCRGTDSGLHIVRRA